jgi:uncharacterized protein YwqG
MALSRLAPLHGESADTEFVERPFLVMVSTNDDETGIVARQSLVTERTLNSIQEEESDFDLVRHQYATSWLAPDNPFLNQMQKQRLDARGLALVGAVLQNGDLLASALKTAIPKRSRRARPGKSWVVDDSWVAPPEWEGAQVSKVRVLRRRELPRSVSRTVSERVQIAVRAEHELAAGNVLLFRRRPLGVLGRFVADDEMPRHGNQRVDLLLPRRVGAELGLPPGGFSELMLGKAFESGAQAIQARAMEAYSLITKQPLLSTPYPGQVIWANHIRWLQERGLVANIAELTSLKSDDLGNRSNLKKLLKGNCLNPQSIPAAGAPESLLITQTYLKMLCLDAKLEQEGNAVAISVRPAADEDILGWSLGQVRKPETIHYRDLEEAKTGLFCPEIFGTPTKPRRRRFGHILLPCPVVSLLWRVGSPSVLETALELPGKTLEALLTNELWARRSNNQWEIFPAPTEPYPADAYTGALAIEAMLKTAPKEKLPNGCRERPNLFTHRLVPVPPPEIRPLVLLDNGNWATADINDLYRRLINRANRLAKLEELKAPPVIILNERRELQESYDALQANCLLPDLRAVLHEGGQGARLVDCLALLAGHLLSSDKKGAEWGESKRVEWCGRARAVGSRVVPNNQMQVPRKIFNTLRLDPQAPVLLTSPDSSAGTFVSLLPRPHDDAVVRMPLAAFSQLGLLGNTPMCVIHRPLGCAACAEAKRLLDGETLPGHRIPSIKSWLDASDLNDLTTQLTWAALSGSRTVLQSPSGLLIGGTGSLALAEDDDLPTAEQDVREVDIPPQPIPLERGALRARMLEVLDSCKRKACVFHLAPVDEALPIGQPHAGGLPDLPPELEWPKNRDGQLQFLAQLPLDPVREAGILPIEASPGALLSIFASYRSDHGCTAPGPAFICTASQKLTRRAAEKQDYVHPWCKVLPEIVEEYPCWEEVLEIFASEIGLIHQKDLKAFREEEYQRRQHPFKTVKIGGWPAWIQTPEREDPLLAQLASGDDAEIVLVDDGTLYIFVSPRGELDVLVQYS